MKKENKYKNIIKTGKKILELEAKSILNLSSSLDENFYIAVNQILKSQGKIIFTGIGKSGLIAKKISATFSSIGIESFYLHPVEALHGDMGSILRNDIIIALSNSGKTEELNKFLIFIKKKNNFIISFTSNSNSKLANLSHCVIDLKVKEEACPYNIVPTSSTTTMLSLGDALAITLMQLKGFNKDNFANFHPSGNLGKLLNLKVHEIMRKNNKNPIIRENETMDKALKVMTKTSIGAVTIVSKNKKVIGFFTDGDLRRNFLKINIKKPISLYMTKNPLTINENDSASLAAKIMQEKNIDNLPVTNNENKLVGILDERDLIKEGLL